MTLRSRLLCGAFAASVILTGAPAIAATETAQATAEATTAVGDVVITARKREENLQRVPLAVTAQTGRQLEQQRVTQVNELGRITPSLRVFTASSSDNSAQISMRGQVASDTLIGVSQPIGLYEDTVNIPHPFGANNAFFDLTRVETLKGPQGTLYGRNTTGGAINIITRDADFNGWHGFAGGEVGTFQSYKWGGAVNIPLIEDRLAMRIAYQRWDKTGFGRSLVNGQDLGNDHHDNLLRVSIKWNPLDNVHGNFKMEYGDAHHTGQFLSNMSLCGVANSATGAGNLVAGTQVCGPQFTTQPVFSAVGTYNARRGLAAGSPNSAYIQNALANDPLHMVPLFNDALNTANAAEFNQVLAAGAAVLAPCIGTRNYTNCLGTREFDNLTTWHGVADLTWDITPDISLRSISGYHSFVDWKDGDLDATQGQILEIGAGSASTGGIQIAPGQGPKPLPYPLKADQESGQFSQELDFAGRNLFGRVDWLVGAFVSIDRGHGAQASATNEDLGVATGCAVATPASTTGAGCSGPFVSTSHDGIAIDNKTWAIYTQNDFKIFEFGDGGSFKITAGGRYTHEHLTNMLSNWDYNYYTGAYTCEGGALGAGGIASTVLPLPIPVANQPDSCAYAQGVTPTGAAGSALGPNDSFQNAVFTGWSYLASANLQVNRNVLVYFKTARGFRGGAYGRTNAPAAQPELATDYELGFKGDFFDHRLRLNLAAYQTDYTNKQVSVLTCNGGGSPPCSGGFSTAVVNAASARMRGIEVETVLRPFEGMTLAGNMSWSQAKYVKWVGAVSGDGNALCIIKPDLSGLIVNPATNTVITANQCVAPNVPAGVTVPNPSGDAAGLDLGVTPTWQAAISARYEHPIGPGIGAVELDWQYIGEIPITPINHQIAVPLAVEQFMHRAVGLVNASVEFRIPDQGLTLAVWGSNLTNQYYGNQGISATFNAGIGHYLLYDPRMFGISIRKTFGRD